MSIGHIATDKVYCVLFDSSSSKTLILKCVVPCNYIPIQSNDELWIFSIAETTLVGNEGVMMSSSCNKVGLLSNSKKGVILEDIFDFVILSYTHNM